LEITGTLMHIPILMITHLSFAIQEYMPQRPVSREYHVAQ
jgi:hypothetical protein